MKGNHYPQKTPRTAQVTLNEPPEGKLTHSHHKPLQNLPPAELKEHPDSKTSTQDQTHKVDSPQLQLKDISQIALSESLVCIGVGHCPDDNNSSGISIINMLERDIPETSPQNMAPLNLEIHDENDNLKKDLEMKNRLIEKLMKENSNLREEIESLLTTMEEKKLPKTHKTQNYNNRILELEHQIVYLEGENQTLKEKLRSDSEESSDKDIKIRLLEDQVEKYCQTTKKEMEELYSKFQQQLKFYAEVSKHQVDDFSKVVKEQIEEMKTSNPRIPLESKDQNRYHINGEYAKKKNGLSFERRSNTEESLTPTSAMPLSTRSNLSPNMSLSAKKTVTESLQLPSKGFKNFVPIDENPELVKERRVSTAQVKTYQVQSKTKKKENEENNLNRRNSTVHKSLNKESFSQKLGGNRITTGLSSCEKRK